MKKGNSKSFYRTFVLIYTVLNVSSLSIIIIRLFLNCKDTNFFNYNKKIL